MAGWGDFIWGIDPWDGQALANPIVKGFVLLWDDEAIDERLGPTTLKRGFRFPFTNSPPGHALCHLVPEFMCVEDLDERFGGTGDWHRLLAIIYDWLFGTTGMTGLVDDIASFACITDINTAPDPYLDIMLLDIGFDLKVPLTTEDKRRVLKFLVDLYRRKGTAPGIANAISLLLKIPAEILFAVGTKSSRAFECGFGPSVLLTDVVNGSTSCRVSEIEKFKVGSTFTLIDTTPPNQILSDVMINNIVADELFFDAVTLADTIEAGAVARSNYFSSAVGKISVNLNDASKIGIDTSSRQDPGNYTFFVDVQRTVTTTSAINDGDTQVGLSNLDFITVGSRIRITDASAPLEPAFTIEVKDLDQDALTVDFDPVSLTETVEAGASAINLFTADQIELVRRVVDFAKPSHTHFAVTRDEAAALAEVG